MVLWIASTLRISAVGIWLYVITISLPVCGSTLEPIGRPPPKPGSASGTDSG
jgi:hypothetical protein